MSDTFTLPWPPTVNTYWRCTVMQGRPRVLLSRKGRAFQKAALSSFLTYSPITKLTGPVCVHMTLHPPTKRAIDIDNRAKAVLDAITYAGIWDDDSQVDDLRITRGSVLKDGAVCLRISPSI